MNPNQNVNDSDLMNQSNVLANYKQQLGQYYQLMVDAFAEIDKNKDSYIDQRELTQFLDSKMPNGKIFDRQLFKKIFESIDTDLNGKLSLDEFITTYISKHEELKVHQEDLKSKVDADREAMQEFQKMMFEKKNEIVNSKNISKDAKLFVEIENLRPLNISPNILRTIRTIKVKLDLDDNSKLTSGRTINNLVFGEKFEFPITSTDDGLFIEASADGGICSGQSMIPLSTITDQNEKDLELELHNENEDTAVWLLKLKITLITSYYRLYQDNYFKAERRYAQNLAALEKINSGLESLSEPFNFLSRQGDNILNVSGESRSNYQSAGKIDLIQFQVADRVEELVKNSLNAPNIQWVKIIHYLLLGLLLISSFNLFLRSDFITLMVVLYAFVAFYTTFNSKPIQDLKVFIIVFGICVVYDFFYMIFSPVFAHYSYEGSLKNFGGLLTLIGFLLKIVLLVSSWIQKLKLERARKKSGKPKDVNLNI